MKVKNSNIGDNKYSNNIENINFEFPDDFGGITNFIEPNFPDDFGGIVFENFIEENGDKNGK